MVLRSLSVVLLDVEYSPADSGLSEEQALQQLFAFTGPMPLRDKSGTLYFTGNYRKHQKRWSGEFGTTRNAQPLSMKEDRSEGFQFSVSETPVVTRENGTAFVYDPENHIIAYWERAPLPYTRLSSYVDGATRAKGRKFRVELKPRTEERTVTGWLQHFDTINQISLTFRHSQSPGNRFVDEWFEATNAKEISETVKAPKGDALKVDALLEVTPIGQVVEHIDVNPKNGKVQIQGEVGGDHLTVDTRDAISRKKITAEAKPAAVVSALLLLLSELFGKR